MDFCRKCGTIIWNSSGVCQCDPYSIIYDGEEYNQYAGDEESAAHAWAREYNEDGDYNLMDETVIILVNGNKYRVGAEPDTRYSVEKLERS